MYITDHEALTPVQTINGLRFKRDDLFRPFGEDDVNGGKLRQCIYLIQNNIEKAKNGVFTLGDTTSPQQAIVSAVCEYLNLKCIIYTACKENCEYNMVKLAKSHGAEYIHFKGLPNGKIRSVCREADGVLVKYGINMSDNKEALLGAVSKQVENLPNKIRRLYITCGSGITSTGIILGLDLFGKEVEEVVLVGNPSSRQKEVEKYLSENRKYSPLFGTAPYIDKKRKIIFEDNDIEYKKRVEANIGDLKFHPNYEAHMWEFVNRKYDISEKDLFWIVGSEPKLP